MRTSEGQVGAGRWLVGSESSGYMITTNKAVSAHTSLKRNPSQFKQTEPFASSSKQGTKVRFLAC